MNFGFSPSVAQSHNNQDNIQTQNEEIKENDFQNDTHVNQDDEHTDNKPTQESNKRAGRQPRKQFTRTRSSVHPIIEELLEAGIPVRLLADGYEIGGFYGQNGDGFMPIFEQNEDDSLVALNTKGKPFEVNSISDLARYNVETYHLYQDEYNFLINNIWLDLIQKHAPIRISVSLV